MDIFVPIMAHLSVAYLHILLAWRFYPQRTQSYTVYVFWVMMGVYAALHLFYGLGFVMELFRLDFLFLVMVLISNWILAFLPTFMVPVIIGELTKAPARLNPINKALLFLTANARPFFYVAIGISVTIILSSLPEQLPLDDWKNHTFGNIKSLYFVLSVGALWLFMLLMGLRPAPSEWSNLGRPLRYLFGALLVLYAVTGWTDMGRYWILVPIISTVSFSLVFSWYRFRLQFMDMILNQFVSLSLLILIVIGFYQVSHISIEVGNEAALRLLLYATYVLTAFVTYQFIAGAFKRIWRPSGEQLALIHSDLPRLLSQTTDSASAQKVTAEFLSQLFECDVSFRETPLTQTTIDIDGGAGFSLHMGYMKGWIPWLSEAISWVRTAGLHLQSHQQILSAMEELHQQSLKNEALSTLAARAELDAMRAQIRPHFLFNTLNSIHSFVREDPDQAEKVIELLADLMRGVLQSAERDLVPLSQELDLVDTYLQIERVRYGSRLSFSIDQPSTLGSVSIPPFSVQPLVENAVKHGVDGQLEPVHVEVSIQMSGSNLQIEVKDNGPGLSTDETKGIGMALTNIRARLERLYNGEASLNVSNSSRTGVIAVLEIPLSCPKP